MNWNSNDTKYILKRFIIYILICIAMFIIGTWKAKALVSVPLQQPANQCSTLNGACYFTYNNVFYNGGKGTIYFSTFVTSGNPTTVPVVDATVEYSDGTATGCKVGDIQSYNDNLHSNILQTIECPVDLTGKGVKRIYVDNKNQGSNPMYYSYRMTFVEETAVNMSGVIAAINNNNYTSLLTNIYNDLSAFKTRTNEQLVDLYYLIQQQGQDLNTINNSINNVNNSVNDVNDSINNDNITESDADDFSNNQAFSDSTGLESVIQLPLNMVNTLTNSCQPIQITIPFIDYTGEIPCMSTIYKSKFNTLYTIVKLVINGFFVYRLLLKIYELVHNAKQPDEDKLEVIEL